MAEADPRKPGGASSKAREWLGRLALLSVSSLLIVATIEIAARVIRAGQGGGKEGQEDALYKEYDPLLGWRKRKDALATYHRREYTVDVKMNSQGLRDPERPIEPPQGVFRILAVGDSFTEGYTVPLEKTVTRRLDARLGESGCRADVINGGTSAYSTDQEYLFYASDGARYRPSLVLVFFFWNDVIYVDRQDYFGSPKPAFQIVDGGIRLHRYPVKQVERKATGAHAAPPEEPGSALLEMIRERLWYGAPNAHDALARLGLWNPIPKMDPRLEILVFDRRDLAPVEDAWEKVGAILKAFKSSVESRGARLGVVYVPASFEIQDGAWSATQQLYRLKPNAWDRDKPVKKLERIGAEVGFPVLDLRPSLRAAETAFDRTYFRFDFHWNERGHDAASQAVASWLRETRQLAGSCGGALETTASSGAVWEPSSGGVPR